MLPTSQDLYPFN